MMKRWLGWMGVLISCSLLSGCLAFVPLEVSAGLSQSGDAITLNQGQELVVELERSAGSAYVWNVVSGGAKVLSEPVNKTLQNQQVLIDRYTFTALFIGTDQLRIEEKSQGTAHQAGAVPRVFILNITVTK